MIARMHEIGQNGRGSALAGYSHSPESGNWNVSLSLKRELLVFFRRFGFTFREVFREWRRWGWPTLHVVRPVSSASLGYGNNCQKEEAMPRLDVARGDESVLVRLEALGMNMKREDVRVEFFDGVMMLSGMCPVEEEKESGGRWETFFYNVSIPKGISGGDAQIEFRDGKLEVKVASPQSSGLEPLEAI